MTRVLFLHGASAGPHGRKRQALDGERDFTVTAPALPFPSVGDVVRTVMNPTAGDWSGYRRACEVAQAAADAFGPDVIVGSSMGGAVALGIESPAGRVLIAPATTLHVVRVPGLPREWRIPARTVILHSGSDEIVPFAASARLLEEATKVATPGDAAVIDSIRRQLVEAGYSTLHDRLVRIGRDHQCNEPHPQDVLNKGLCPLVAMIRAVRIVAGLAA